MLISIDTRLIALIGEPLGQSFAARMQNAAFQAAGVNMCYFYNEAGQEHLPAIIEGVRFMSAFAGAAVTKPNKVAVMKLLDELDPFCEKVGACNTIVKDADGRLIGYNTDGYGFIESIVRDGGVELVGQTCFCIGAGGAARPICAMLAEAGAAKVYVTDLIEKSTRSLVDDLRVWYGSCIEVVPPGDYSHCCDCALVVNASGVGMGATIGSSPLPSAFLKPDVFYYDACYNPIRTQFLLDAESVGAHILNGLGMSLFQGARQFELWSGIDAPIDTMRSELNAILAEREIGSL